MYASHQYLYLVTRKEVTVNSYIVSVCFLLIKTQKFVLLPQTADEHHWWSWWKWGSQQLSLLSLHYLQLEIRLVHQETQTMRIKGVMKIWAVSHLDYFYASKRQFKSFQLEIPVTSKQYPLHGTMKCRFHCEVKAVTDVKSRFIQLTAAGNL